VVGRSLRTLHRLKNSAGNQPDGLRPNGAVLTRSQGLEAYMKNKDFPSPFVLDETKAEVLGNS